MSLEKDMKKDLNGVVKYYLKPDKKAGKSFIDYITSKQDFILDVEKPKEIYIKQENGLEKKVTMFQMIAIKDFEVGCMKVRKGQRGAWVELGTTIDKGCWADENSMVLGLGTRLCNKTYVHQSNIYNNVILNDCRVTGSSLNCLDAKGYLNMKNCYIQDTEIEFSAYKNFEHCNLADSKINCAKLDGMQKDKNFIKVNTDETVNDKK